MSEGSNRGFPWGAALGVGALGLGLAVFWPIIVALRKTGEVVGDVAEEVVEPVVDVVGDVVQWHIDTARSAWRAAGRFVHGRGVISGVSYSCDPAKPDNLIMGGWNHATFCAAWTLGPKCDPSRKFPMPAAMNQAQFAGFVLYLRYRGREAQRALVTDQPPVEMGPVNLDRVNEFKRAVAAILEGTSRLRTCGGVPRATANTYAAVFVQELVKRAAREGLPLTDAVKEAYFSSRPRP